MSIDTGALTQSPRRAIPHVELPVIDISPYVPGSTDPASREVVIALREAAHEYGFLQLTGHGIPTEVTDGILAATRSFFALALEEREEISNLNSPQFRGYTSVATEYTDGNPDLREQVDIGPERAALPLGPGDPAYLRLIGPNQWPSALPAFREAVLALSLIHISEPTRPY